MLLFSTVSYSVAYNVGLPLRRKSSIKLFFIRQTSASTRRPIGFVVHPPTDPPIRHSFILSVSATVWLTASPCSGWHASCSCIRCTVDTRLPRSLVQRLQPSSLTPDSTHVAAVLSDYYSAAWCAARPDQRQLYWSPVGCHDNAIDFLVPCALCPVSTAHDAKCFFQSVLDLILLRLMRNVDSKHVSP